MILSKFVACYSVSGLAPVAVDQRMAPTPQAKRQAFAQRTRFVPVARCQT